MLGFSFILLLFILFIESATSSTPDLSRESLIKKWLENCNAEDNEVEYLTHYLHQYVSKDLVNRELAAASPPGRPLPFISAIVTPVKLMRWRTWARHVVVDERHSVALEALRAIWHIFSSEIAFLEKFQS